MVWYGVVWCCIVVTNQNHSCALHAGFSELQTKRDEFCQEHVSIGQKTYARYDRERRSANKNWICCAADSLTKDLSRYDIVKASESYYLEDKRLTYIQDFSSGKLRFYELVLILNSSSSLVVAVSQ